MHRIFPDRLAEELHLDGAALDAMSRGHDPLGLAERAMVAKLADLPDKRDVEVAIDRARELAIHKAERDILADLPPRQQTVIRMAVAGFTQKRIAQFIGIRENNVQLILKKHRDRVAECYNIRADILFSSNQDFVGELRRLRNTLVPDVLEKILRGSNDYVKAKVVDSLMSRTGVRADGTGDGRAEAAGNVTARDVYDMTRPMVEKFLKGELQVRRRDDVIDVASERVG